MKEQLKRGLDFLNPKVAILEDNGDPQWLSVCAISSSSGFDQDSLGLPLTVDVHYQIIGDLGS